MATDPFNINIDENDADISLLEILDHVLNAGVVVHGSIVISLAGVDLVYLGMNLVLTSIETALRHLDEEDRPRLR
jgi:gas vesicle structural protein